MAGLDRRQLLREDVLREMCSAWWANSRSCWPRVAEADVLVGDLACVIL